MIVDKLLERALEIAEERSLPRPGAYNAGACVRALWYMRHGVAGEPVQARAILLFDVGNRVEEAVLGMIEKSGIEGFRAGTVDDMRSVRLFGDDERGEIRVRPDFFFESKGALVVGEIKSMSNFAFERAERGEIDEGYRAQLECYLRAFETEFGLFVLYRKETSHLHEVPYSPDDALWEKVKRAAERSAGEELPDRPYRVSWDCVRCRGTKRTASGVRACGACNGTGKEPGGPFIPVFPCGYCAWKSECWGGVELDVRGGKPRFRALLGA